ETLRRALAGMYAGPGAEAATARQRVRGVLAHNMHSVNTAPTRCPWTAGRRRRAGRSGCGRRAP
ncbi:unnamed protein product, partial [Prorocentrum cordatum]